MRELSELERALMASGNAGSREEAAEIVAEMRERFYDGEHPEELLYEYNLEPDYIFDLLY